MLQRSVDFVELRSAKGVGRNIGDEQTPTVAQQAFAGGGRSALPRFALAHAAVLGGVGRVEAGGDEAARDARAFVASDEHGSVDAVGGGLGEQVAEFDSVACGEGDAGGQPADPVRVTVFQLLEDAQVEEAHVAHDEVAAAAVVEDLVGEGLVGVPGVVEVAGEDVAAEQVAAQEALAAGGFDPSVAVVGEVDGIAPGHGDDGGILDDDAVEGGVLEPCENRSGLRGEQFIEGGEEESAGCGREALLHGLAAHGVAFEAAELHGEVVEGAITLRDRPHQGEQEARGAELAGAPLDEPRLSCDGVEFGEAQGEVGIEHADFAGPFSESSFFADFHQLQLTQNQSFVALG